MTHPAQDLPISPAQRLQAVLARLALSRSAIRQQLLPTPEAPRADPADGAARSAPLRRLWQSLGRFSRRWPVVTVVVDAARSWWHHHPWRATGDLLAHGVGSQVQNLVRRHPVATVASAALLGGVVMALRPWRWQMVGNQLAPVPGRLGHWLMGQFGSAPMQAALASLLVMALRPTEPAATPADESPPPPEPGAERYNGADGPQTNAGRP